MNKVRGKCKLTSVACYLSLRQVSGLNCEHLVHAACWDIIERIIGHQAEDRLDLMLQAMKDGWHKNSYGVEGLITEYGGWLGDRILEGTTHQHRLIPATDPIEILAFHKLVAKSLKGAIGEEASSDTRPVASIAASGVTPGTLPVEIQVLILNLLSNWPDINDALEAFSWQLPDFLWREWFPLDLIFDALDEIPNYKINWKTLYTGTMHLLNTSLAMRNRQRIVRVVNEIREDFLGYLETSLQINSF